MKCSNFHLTYCTNIHPAESWEDTQSAIKKYTLKVRDTLRKNKKLDENTLFGIGLRLSARAATELLFKKNLTNFKNYLKSERCYVFTINGFPYGDFHGRRVKEKVFQPDWTTPERLNYTKNLFTILAHLLPKGVDGSVSTLPGSLKYFRANESKMFSNLRKCAQYIEDLSIKHSRDLHLGLEPEPLGHFEDTDESIAFFEKLYSSPLDSTILSRRIGLCYDTCHFALQFEDPEVSISRLIRAGIRISKIQVSSALELQTDSTEALQALNEFDEPTYLHQVIIPSSEGRLIRFADIPDFIKQIKKPFSPGKARVHFHIPLYCQPKAPIISTQKETEKTLSYIKKNPELCRHLEMETYTWDVLPIRLKTGIEKQIIREYNWLMDKIK